MSDHEATSREIKSTYAGEAPANVPSSIRFEEIAKGELEVVIEYRTQLYRLRATKNGKLVLNK